MDRCEGKHGTGTWRRRQISSAGVWMQMGVDPHCGLEPERSRQDSPENDRFFGPTPWHLRCMGHIGPTHRNDMSGIGSLEYRPPPPDWSRESFQKGFLLRNTGSSQDGKGNPRPGSVAEVKARKPVRWGLGTVRRGAQYPRFSGRVAIWVYDFPREKPGRRGSKSAWASDEMALAISQETPPR